MAVIRFGVALFLALIFAYPVSADSVTVGSISQQLVCQCGCTMILSNCSHTECASREAMTALVKQELAQGKSEAEIMQSLVGEYGEQVLAAPPKRGFSLTAWITPLVVLVFGGGIVYMALNAWVRRGKNRQTQATAEAEQGDEAYEHQLQKELDEFAGRGFR